jgi:hypothetical protein
MLATGWTHPQHPAVPFGGTAEVIAIARRVVESHSPSPIS